MLVASYSNPVDDVTGELRGRGPNSVQGGGHHMGGPLGAALSIGTSSAQQRPDGYFKETMHEVISRNHK